jgi:hypothetical protein
MALRIGKFAGNGPALWLRMQQAYDLWYAEHRMKDELSKIETVASVGSSAQRIRLDCVSEANHNLNRLLDKPGLLYKK